MVTAVTNAAATAATTTASTTTTGTSLNSDFQTFLVMLTTQMQNQDPLNPIESTEYATQLATFSQVEQAVKSNELLEGLATQLSAIGMSQLAGWVGMEARSDAPAYFDGADPVTLAAPTVGAGVDQTVLVIKDASGAVVQSGEVTLNGATLEWDGVAADGSVAANGLYTFEMESYQNGAKIATTAVESYSLISEAQITSAGTTLVLKGGSEILSSEATALRQPE